MRRAVFAIACVASSAAALAGCGSKKRQGRTSDAAPIEEIKPMALVDGAPPSSGPAEIEPNDGDEVATPLALGATMRGAIDPETDVDHFRIDVPAAGVLAVEVATGDGDIIVELEDANGTVLARSDRSGAKVREGFPNYGVQPGRYVVVVKGKRPPAPKGRTPPKPPPGPIATYEILAQLGKLAPNAEREPDDDRGTANELILGETGTGFIGWDKDTDVWKLSTEAVSANNAVHVELSPVEGLAFTLELSDGVGAPILTRKGPRGAGLFVRDYVPNLPPGAPPYNYITVRADRSNPEVAYQLHIAQKVPQTDAEIEPNDSPERPYPIPPDRTVVHATWSAGDVDCFAVAPEDGARTLEATVDVPPEADLRVELHVDGKLAGKADKPGKGVAEKITGQVPAKGRAVVCVRGADIAGEASYDLNIRDLPAAKQPHQSHQP
ncbi:MAG: PPC domain-containing protein [Deltaproteobacteria bacterium]|nr:PPC domain-containing protein [Deltaproteobacteria bacterium]